MTGALAEQLPQAPPASDAGRLKATFGVFLAACLVYGFGLGSFGLVARGEPRYATVAREMLATGDFVTTRIEGMVYLDKPPLLHWMNAASMAIFGNNEWAFRLPTMLFAAACTALVYWIARQVFGRREALCSALVLASCILWFVMARHARFDMPLAALVTGGLWACWWASEGGRERRGAYYAAAVIMGLGMLLKGPIIVLLVGGSYVVYLALMRRLAALQHVPWVPCVALFLVIAAPWYIACELANPGYLGFFFGHENAWRITREVPYRQPWWHTIGFLLGGIVPWSLCLPGVLRRLKRDPLTEPGARLALLLTLSVIATIAIYIPPPVKFVQYIVPAIPALALLIGRVVAGGDGGGRRSLIASAAVALVMAIGAGMYGASFFSDVGLPGTLAPVWAGLLALGALVGLYGAFTGRRVLATAALAAGLILPLHATYPFIGRTPPYVISEKPVIEAAIRHAQAGQPLVAYARSGFVPAAAFYYYPGDVISIGTFVSEFDYPGNEGHFEGKWVPHEREGEVLATPPAKVGIAKQKLWGPLQQAWPHNVRLLEVCEPYVIFETVPAEGGNG